MISIRCELKKFYSPLILVFSITLSDHIAEIKDEIHYVTELFLNKEQNLDVTGSLNK